MMPLTSIQPQRPLSSRLCSSAYMMVAKPSTAKKTMATRVSDTAPLTGQPISAMPARMPITAESSDHQNPGSWRARNVVTRPTMPLMRKSQPRKIVTDSVASGGMMMAAAPRITRMMPSQRGLHRALKAIDVGLVRRHGRPPWLSQHRRRSVKGVPSSLAISGPAFPV